MPCSKSVRMARRASAGSTFPQCETGFFDLTDGVIH